MHQQFMDDDIHLSLLLSLSPKRSTYDKAGISTQAIHSHLNSEAQGRTPKTHTETPIL